MLQTTRWSCQGLASTPLSHCSRLVHLPGYLARYSVLGDPESPPLVILPGLAGGMDLCLPLASRLSQQFSVYILQPRGEDTPYDFSHRTSIEHLGTDLIDFQKVIGLERPMVFAHGIGATIALEAARQCPGRFAGVIAQGIAPQLGTVITSWLLHQSMKPSSGNALHDIIAPMFGSRWVLPDLKQLALEHAGHTDLGVISRRLQLFAGFDMESMVDGLRLVPLLIQTGTHDVFVSPEAWKPWRRVLPRMTLQTLENAGHFAFLTHTEALATQIERFASRRLGMPMQLPAV
jgi:pimeloyl-ACP methyl ester carboxylesterase